MAIAFLAPISVVSGNVQTDLQQLILEENAEGVRWLKKVYGRTIRPIPEPRARAMSFVLADLEARDPEFFWDAYFPMVWSESVFCNRINDRNKSRKRWSIGYCGLQVGTARSFAVRLGYEIPMERCAAEVWLIQNWEANLEIGYVYLKFLYDLTGQRGLKSLSAYRTGIHGYNLGRVAITNWMRQVQRRSQIMGMRSEVSSTMPPL